MLSVNRNGPAAGTVEDSGSSSQEKNARSYRPDVDGLRSLAILPVVLYHAGVGALSGGFAGVDIFFVISGYLIGGHINAELTAGHFRFSEFYKRRAKRILPALFTVLCFCLCVGLVLLSPRELRDLALYVGGTTASISNFVLWKTTGYFAANADLNPLLMTWSLGVEEQFYIVIPILMVILARFRKHLTLPVICLLIAVSFLFSCYQVYTRPTSAFYLPQSRTWELGVGVALALFQARKRAFAWLERPFASSVLSFVGMCLVVMPFFLLTTSTRFPGPAAIPSVLGTAILLASNDGWINRKILTLSPLVFIGRISYSFYLWHWPILSFMRIIRESRLPVSWGLGAVAVAAGIATFSYYFVEIPFRSSKLPAKPLLLRYGAVSLIFLLCSGLLYKAGGIPKRFPALASLDETGTLHDPCLTKSGQDSPRLVPACVGDATSSKQHIALWGDSHASAIASALREKAAKQDYFVEEYTKTSCPPLAGVGRYYRLDPKQLQECISFNNSVLHRLTNQKDVSTVVLEAFWGAPFDPTSKTGKLAAAGGDPEIIPTAAESEQLFESSLHETLKALVDAGKKVVVLGDGPVFDTDPVWRMRTAGIPLRGKLAALMTGNCCTFDPGTDMVSDNSLPQRAEREILQRQASDFPNVAFWNLRQNLCDASEVCSYRQAGTAYFIDPNHMSTQGSRKALEGWGVPAPLPSQPES